MQKKTNSRTRWLDKKPQLKKQHITKKEYRKTTAKSVDDSLNDLFKGVR